MLGFIKSKLLRNKNSPNMKLVFIAICHFCGVTVMGPLLLEWVLKGNSKASLGGLRNNVLLDLLDLPMVIVIYFMWGHYCW